MGCWPSRFRTSPGRWLACGSRGACSKASSSPVYSGVLVAARLIHADLERVARAGSAAQRCSRVRSRIRAIERRLELSVDPEGNLLDTASPQLAAARREVQAARQRLLRRLDALLRALDSSAAASDASVTVRGGRYVIPVRRDSRGPAAGDHSRRVGQRGHALHRAIRRRSSWATRCGRRRSRRSGRRCGCSAS